MGKPVWALIAAFGLAGLVWTFFERDAPKARSAAPEPKAPRSITAAELKKKRDSGGDPMVAFVGSASYYRDRRIPGSVCVPYADLERVFRTVDRSREVVVYCGCCSGTSEGLSGAAVRDLEKLGFTNVSHLQGHYAAWQRAGYASEGDHPASSPERAWNNEDQKARLEAFSEEAGRRRHEVAGLVDAERDPEKKEHLKKVLTETERSIEIDGLQLKRALALENGDSAKVAGIDALLAQRGVPVRQ